MQGYKQVEGGWKQWEWRLLHQRTTFFFAFFSSFFDHRNKNLIIITSKIEWIFQFERVVVLSISQLIVNRWPRQTTKRNVPIKHFSFDCFLLSVYEKELRLQLWFFSCLDLDVDRSLPRVVPTAPFLHLKQVTIHYSTNVGDRYYYNIAISQTPTGTRFPPSHPHIQHSVQPPHTFHFHSYFRKLQCTPASTTNSPFPPTDNYRPGDPPFNVCSNWAYASLCTICVLFKRSINSLSRFSIFLTSFSRFLNAFSSSSTRRL